MGDDERDDEIEPMRRYEAPAAVEVERSARALLGDVTRAVHETLDGTKQRFREHGLGTGPAAPDTPEKRGEVEQPEAEARDEEEYEPHVLRVEGRAEEKELTSS